MRKQFADDEYYAYELWDGANPFYVGKGSGNRVYEHLHPCNLELSRPIYYKLRNMADFDFERDANFIMVNTDAEAIAEEIRLIAFYGTRYDGTGCLLNMTKGGEGVSGHRHSEEARRKMSLAHSTLAARKALSERSIGNQYGLGTIALTRRPVLKIYRGKVLERFDFLSQVRIKGFHFPNVWACCNDQRSSHKGYQWMYEDKWLELQNKLEISACAARQT